MRVDGNRRFFNIMHRTTPLQEEDFASDSTPSLPYAMKVHVLPFKTHTGDTTQPGYMVFENYTPIALPLLLSFIIYFTHRNVSPSTADLEGLYKALTGYHEEVVPRLVIYLLPGATEKDCVAHCHAEQRTYDSYQAEIVRFNALSTSSPLGLPPWPPASPGRLPGMMLNGDDEHPAARNSVTFFICAERNWQDGKQCLLYMNLYPRGGENESPSQNQRVPLTDLAFDRELTPINDASPLNDELTAVGGYILPVDRYIENANYEADDEVERVWRMATYHGWTNWG
ncbi:hypothetical protein BJY04DRAFT_217218 [Aspergillus karnatakaensis]|uniref:uncharacterized protein n=1 Tax=Aspergillus karnatakaensis TaxID=1810916 RepID=UPI003CCD36D2